ncbi:MAG: Mov34/MPN/PAD-1 family protein [Myxococcota bacterium]
MSLTLPSKELSKLHAHAQEGYPHEVVGIIAGDKAARFASRIHPLVNERSDSAHNRYKVSGLTLMRAEQAIEAEGLDILGYYHSHPDHTSQYSDYDRDHALPNLSYVIVSVMDGHAVHTASWRLKEDRSAMDPEPIHTALNPTHLKYSGE